MINALIYDTGNSIPFDGIRCASQEEFLGKLRNSGSFDIALLFRVDGDVLPLGGFLRAISHRAPLLPVILAGASDETLSPLVDEILLGIPTRKKLNSIVHELLQRRKLMSELELVGRSNALAIIADTIIRIADTNINVLITGESGTGKELVAQAIHNHSGRADAPFIAINCSAIPETLFESQLFGHKKGAFTGANRDASGFLAGAAHGTLFLDEVGDIPLATQVKLLRVLESGEYFPVGSAEVEHTDARIVAATNRDPKIIIKQGTFREDLYYRISGVRIFIPPLRERLEDIPILAAYFANIAKKNKKEEFAGFGDDAIDEMMNYHWPGNVRELRNLVETAVVLSKGAIVRAADLIPYFQEHEQFGRSLPALRFGGAQDTTNMAFLPIMAALQQNNSLLREIIDMIKTPPSIENAERDAIIEALKKSGGSRKKAAETLQISTRTMYRKMKKYGLK